MGQELPKMEFDTPAFVYEGQEVYAPYSHEGKPCRILCVVVTAAGHHARVENEKRNFEGLFHIDDLRTRKPTVH